jgi:hypothetical protein
MCASSRISRMAASLLDGMRGEERFYAGRVFGFGEMPGFSSENFPVLSAKGFEKVADWFSSSFVTPVVSQLTPETFYRGMMELSMDMVMLHLDTRLVIHAFRLGGGNAELPFLDSRVAKFFASLAYPARAFYLPPKWVIEAQFANGGYVRREAAGQAPPGTSPCTGPFENLLLAGSLGSYFREMLAKQSVFDHARGLGDFIDESYCGRQLRAFQCNLGGFDRKFISRVAALELWRQTWQRGAAESQAVAIA